MALWLPPVWFVPVKSYRKLARENGPIESLQNVFLFAGIIILVAGISKLSRPLRTFRADLALVYTTVFLREVDVRHFAHGVVRSIINGRIRNELLLGAWIIAVIVSLLQLRKVWGVFIGWVTRPAGMFFVVGAILYVAGGFADTLPYKWHGYVEEVLELGGTWLLLLSALALYLADKRHVDVGG